MNRAGESKQAYLPLLNSETKYQRLYETMMDGFICVDMNGQIVDINSAFQEMLGYSREELCSLTYHDLTPERWHAHETEIVARQVIPRGYSDVYEKEYIRKDGKLIPIELHTALLRDDSGGPAYMWAIVRDISKRKELENALRSSEALLKQRLENVLSPEVAMDPPELRAIIDIQEIQALIDSYYKLSGIPISIVDLKGQGLAKSGWQDICTKFHRIHPDSSRLCVESNLELAAGIPQGEYRQSFCKNGMWHITTPLMIGGFHLGNVVAGQFFFQDESLNYAFFRKQAREYHFDEESYIAALEAVPRISRESVAASLSFFMKLADMISKLSFSNIKLARSLTERESLQKQLLQAQKMEAIGRLAGGVAHDFNNVLTIILGYSNSLLKRCSADESVCEGLNQIKKAADRATALTSMLLAFSRKQVLQSHVVDLKSLIQNSLKLLRRVIGSDIELITDLAEDLGYVKVDATQIDQVIMNLAVNSRDAMPLGGKLTIRASNEILDNRHEPVHAECGNREYVMMAITDSGIGMDEETKCHIFEPFFTTKEMGKGSGLGLAAVYGIISQSGGIITVDSAPNQGTTFKIYLPRAEKKEETEGPSEEAAAEGCETILLVEDDDEVRKLASMYLRTKGYSVLEAANSPIALRIAKEYGSPIHMLITDMLMPGGMNGVELIKSIKRLHPAIGTLIITGYIGEFTENTKLIPEQSVLHKPFNGDDLINKVVKILQAKKSGGLHSVLADKPN